METAQKIELEAEKSFDVLASVRLFQYDLDEFGDIRPETRQRVYDEELSYIAEGVNRPLYTEFALHQQDGQLVYFHRGLWRSYIGSLANNLLIAKREAEADGRRGFMAERAASDLETGYQIAALQPGEKLAFKSEFPQAECDRYGEEFISGELAFQPARKMGFLYEAEKTMDGRTILRSQTVDGNEPDAYAAAMEHGRLGGSIEDMRDAYDAVMRFKYGGEFFAGRRLEGNIPEENAWEAITRCQYLIDYLMEETEELARQNLTDEEAEVAKKRLTYGVWARLKEKLDEESLGIALKEYSYTGGDSIQSQVESAYQSAAGRGETLFGCGGSITGEAGTMQAATKDIFESIFGKRMNCPFCGATQYGDPCSANQFCTACEARVEKGKVTSTGRRRLKKGFFEVIVEEFSAWNRKYKLEQTQKKEKLQNKG